MSRKFLKHGWMVLGIFLLVAFLVFPACTQPVTPTETTLMRIASTDILTQPWNPVQGTNWAYDRFVMDALQDLSVAPDPETGLYVPWRIQKADVVVQTGLPVGVTTPNNKWLNLSFSDEIAVPADAWADFDATTQKFTPAGTGVTAKTKTVIYYPKDIFDVEYHDGSTLSPADFILSAIVMNFDRAKPASDIYDASFVPAYEAFMDHFKGVTFDFDNPSYGLVVTTYDDLWYLDAEWIVQFAGAGFCWYPVSNYGQLSFEATSLGILAESKNELAFSNSKATDNNVEWMSYIGGPSLAILEDDLADVLTSGNANYGYIPYEPTLGDYITASEAVARYQNLKDFYDEHGHFYIGTGPYYMDSVDTSGKVVDLKKFTGYDMPGDLFFSYMTPVPTPPYPDVSGAWVDEISMTAEPDNAAAITKLENDQLDVYAFGIADADLFAEVQSSSVLHYYQNVGSFNEYSFNPVGPVFDSTGEVNPFALPAIRSAMNKAVDRDYIVGDIMGGLGFPRYTAIGTNSGDAITFASELAAITTEYAYDFDAADAEIEAAMLTIDGVTRDADGKYMYNGHQVPVKVLIRTEDERRQFGDYLVAQLDDLGFDATAQYGTSSVLAPIWQDSPEAGAWNAYTGGWISTSISRDEGSNFGAFYTPLWPIADLWNAYTPTPEYLDVATKLWTNDFTSIAERDALFQEAIPLSMEDSARIFLVDRAAFQPVRTEVAVASDAAGGIYGSWLWGATIHFRDEAGVPTAPAT
jgi:hypothetical protein